MTEENPSRRSPLLKRFAHSWADAWRGLPRDVWWLCLAAYVNRSGSAVLPFLSLYLTRDVGLELERAGVLQSLYGIGAIFGAMLGGVLADRWNSKAVQVSSLTLGGLSFFILGNLRTEILLGVGLLVHGLLYEMLRPANSTSIAQATPVELRVRAMALYRFSINLGAASGVLIGGELAVSDYSFVFLFDGATSLVAALVLVLVFRQRLFVRTQGHKAVPGTQSRLAPSPLKDPTYAIFLCLLLPLAMLFFQWDSTIPQYFGREYGFQENTIGRILSTNMVLIIVFEMVLVHRLRHRDPLKIAALGTLFLGLTFLLVPAGRGIAYAILMVAILTLGEMGTSPFLNGFAARHGPESTRGRAMGLFSFAWASAYALAPALGMWVYKEAGPQWLFAGCGILATLISLGYLLLAKGIRARRSPLS